MNNKYLSDFQIIGSTVKNLNIKNDFVSLENNKKLKKRIDISHLVEKTDLEKTYFYTDNLQRIIKTSLKLEDK